MSYVTLQDMISYLNIDTTGDYDELEDMIGAAQQEIENYCKRSFEGTTGTRYFREDSIIVLPVGSQYRPIGSYAGRFSWDARDVNPPYGHTALWLDKELLSISTLTNGDGTVLSSTSYWLEPRNSTKYDCIRLRSDASWIFNTDGEVSIAGTWGFSTGPDATIKQLTKEEAAYLYKSRDNPISEVTAVPELGQMIIPKGMPVHVKMALDQGGYVRAVRFT